MSDDTVVQPDMSKLVSDSKLAQLARGEKLLAFLIPNIPTQIATESILSEDYPRTPEDGDDTRIIITFSNIRGNSVVYKLNDKERASRHFDVDHFMGGYMARIGIDPSFTDVIDNVNNTVLSALNVSLSTVLGIDAEMTNAKQKAFSETVVKFLLAAILPNALDIFIIFKESPPREGADETLALITHMWAVKTRDEEEPTPAPTLVVDNTVVSTDTSKDDE